MKPKQEGTEEVREEADDSGAGSGKSRNKFQLMVWVLLITVKMFTHVYEVFGYVLSTLLSSLYVPTCNSHNTV